MKKKYLGIAIFCVLMVALTAIWRTSLPETQVGEKEITVEVVHGDGSKAEFTYQTDLEYLGELLVSEGLISGEEGPYGLYVETVDGETASYERDCSWWCLTCNGEDSQTGADSVVLEDGSVYTWTYTIG